jgi:organic hydroperoxide reductase OsmC/OhrA
MNTSASTIKKMPDKMCFATRLDWQEQQKGIFTANDVQGTIYVATPQLFGGTGQEWSPEHLFINAIAGCFMTTYLYFAGKLEFNISHFTCLTTGQIKLAGGRYEFTKIDLYPKIYVANELLMEKAQTALQKTEAYCLVSNSVKTNIVYHSEILKDPHPRYI